MKHQICETSQKRKPHRLTKRLIPLCTIIALTFSIPTVTLGEKNKDGFTVRDSKFKDTVDKSEELEENRGKTFADLYGKYVENLKNGNNSNGEQSEDDSPTGTNNTDTAGENKGQSGGALDAGAYFEDPNILAKAVEVNNGKAVPGKAVKVPSSKLDDLIAYAKSCLASSTTGNYIWGGNTGKKPYKRGKNNDGKSVHPTKGADCSGFVNDCYRQIGVTLNARKSSVMRETDGVVIPKLEQARAGDIIFVSGHVVMYLGDYKYIESSGNEYECLDGVSIDSCVKQANGTWKVSGRSIQKIRRVLALTDVSAKTTEEAKANPKKTTGTGSTSSTDTNSTANTTPLKASSDIEELKKKGTPSSPVKTQIPGYSSYGSDAAILYSVGGKYTVGINAGHQAPGYTGCTSGTATTGMSPSIAEYELNLEVANKLKSLLNASGYNVLMVRTTGKVSMDNPTRGELMSKVGCDMSVGIHFNSTGNASDHGFAYTMASKCKGKDWEVKAKKFYDGMASIITSKQQKIKKASDIYGATYTGFDKCTTPNFYFELGFISSASGKQSDTDLPYVISDEYFDIWCNAFLQTMKSQIG